jgi:hypothetical protein
MRVERSGGGEQGFLWVAGAIVACSLPALVGIQRGLRGGQAGLMASVIALAGVFVAYVAIQVVRAFLSARLDPVDVLLFGVVALLMGALAAVYALSPRTAAAVEFSVYGLGLLAWLAHGARLLIKTLRGDRTTERIKRI